MYATAVNSTTTSVNAVDSHTHGMIIRLCTDVHRSQTFDFFRQVHLSRHGLMAWAMLLPQGGIEKLIEMISTKGAAMMQRLTIRDVMAPLVVSVALTCFLYVTERSDARGKGPTKIPSVAEHRNNVEKL